jgi:hypothetical protein
MDPMDWEAEVPGQWNTSLRIHRQCATAEAAYSNTLSHAETPVTKDCVRTLILLMHLLS